MKTTDTPLNQKHLAILHEAKYQIEAVKMICVLEGFLPKEQYLMTGHGGWYIGKFLGESLDSIGVPPNSDKFNRAPFAWKFERTDPEVFLRLILNLLANLKHEHIPRYLVESMWIDGETSMCCLLEFLGVFDIDERNQIWSKFVDEEATKTEVVRWVRDCGFPKRKRGY